MVVYLSMWKEQNRVTWFECRLVNEKKRFGPRGSIDRVISSFLNPKLGTLYDTYMYSFYLYDIFDFESLIIGKKIVTWFSVFSY